MRLLQFYTQNWIGIIIGVGYCVVSLLIFTFILAYGASCPEAGTDVCQIDLRPIMPVLFVITIIPTSIWGVIFYSGQQLLLLSNFTSTVDYSSSFFATILPGVSIAIAIFVCAILGGFVQEISRIIRK